MPDSIVRASEVSFNEAILRVAAAHNRQVTFRYAKGDGNMIETRVLVPSRVMNVDGHVTFSGYDEDRNQVRAYRMDRMKGEVKIV